MRAYVLLLLERQGRDFNVCEYCSELIPNGKWELHHTRYDKATLKDIMIVCKSCNRIGVNVGLS